MNRMSSTGLWLTTLLLAYLLVGCGGGESNTEAGESNIPVEDISNTESPLEDVDGGDEACNLDIGEACYGDEQCESGVCLMSEMAPFGFCTTPCESAPGYCITPEGTVHDNAWCIEIPKDEFKALTHKSMNRFCMRTCSDLDSCQLIAPYQICGDIEYQGNPLFPSDPKWVCQAPSVIGKTPVDPVTCAKWSSENPGFTSEKLLCSNYCNYLKTCQYYDNNHNMECCDWYCFLHLTEGGKTNEGYKDDLTNYTYYYQTHKNSVEACTGDEQFGVPALPDADAPPPAEVICN
jgi:hypothetical protein